MWAHMHTVLTGIFQVTNQTAAIILYKIGFDIDPKLGNCTVKALKNGIKNTIKLLKISFLSVISN